MGKYPSVHQLWLRVPFGCQGFGPLPYITVYIYIYHPFQKQVVSQFQAPQVVCAFFLNCTSTSGGRASCKSHRFPGKPMKTWWFHGFQRETPKKKEVSVGTSMENCPCYVWFSVYSNKGKEGSEQKKRKMVNSECFFTRSEPQMRPQFALSKTVLPPSNPNVGKIPMNTLWLCQNSYWNLHIHSWFTYSRWWFSIAMLVCQRVVV